MKYLLYIFLFALASCGGTESDKEWPHYAKCACGDSLPVVMVAGQSNANYGWFFDGYAAKRYAPGGQALAGTWHPDHDAHYPAMMDCIGYSDPVAFVWIQGEADALGEIPAFSYKINLINFIRRVRADLARPDLPFIIVKLSSPAYPYRDKIISAQEAVATNVPGVFLIETDGLSFIDRAHYTPLSILIIEERINKVLKFAEVLNNERVE